MKEQDGKEKEDGPEVLQEEGGLSNYQTPRKEVPKLAVHTPPTGTKRKHIDVDDDLSPVNIPRCQDRLKVDSCETEGVGRQPNTPGRKTTHKLVPESHKKQRRPNKHPGSAGKERIKPTNYPASRPATSRSQEGQVHQVPTVSRRMGQGVKLTKDPPTTRTCVKRGERCHTHRRKLEKVQVLKNTMSRDEEGMLKVMKKEVIELKCIFELKERGKFQSGSGGGSVKNQNTMGGLVNFETSESEGKLTGNTTSLQTGSLAP